MFLTTAVVLTATPQAQEKVAKREAAEADEEKARSKLEKAKAFLEEAKALVTVYVVMIKRETNNCLCIDCSI